MDGSISQFAYFINDNSLIIIGFLGFLFGFGLAWLLFSKPLTESHQEIIRLRLHIKAEAKIHEERLYALDQARDQMTDTFNSLSQHALRQNNEQFLQLAQENMARFHVHAQSDLDYRQKAFENLVDPVQNALNDARKQLFEIEKERKSSFTSIAEQLMQVSRDHIHLRTETQNLVTALRRPEVRGQWGEVSLRRLIELSGMTQYADFIEQPQRRKGETVIRPDLIIKMPDERELIIDAKTPLDAYLEAVSSNNIETAKTQLKRHAKIVRQHVVELSTKQYWDQFPQSPDFVVLFVPGEQFLGVALEYDRTLLEYAFSKQIILVSPTSLMALLRAVAFGWKQVYLSKNAEKIQQLGEEVYKRVATFTEHMVKVGANLDSSVQHYNKALGSLERTVLPSVRKFSELGLKDTKNIPDTSIIENVPRKAID